MFCSQIYITGINDAENIFMEDMDSFRRVYKENYIFWDDEKIHDLLLMDHEHKKAYESLRPYAYKADLAKYLILYKYGGLAVDPGFFLKENFFVKENALFVFDAPNFLDNKAINNAFMYSIKNNFIIQKIIEKVCHNVLNKIYGNSPWDITGPKLVYDCIMQENIENFKFGNFVNNEKTESNRLYKIVVDDKIIALSKDITTYSYRIRADKTDYSSAWYDGRVYVN